MARVTFHT